MFKCLWTTVAHVYSASLLHLDKQTKLWSFSKCVFKGVVTDFMLLLSFYHCAGCTAGMGGSLHHLLRGSRGAHGSAEQGLGQDGLPESLVFKLCRERIAQSSQMQVLCVWPTLAAHCSFDVLHCIGVCVLRRDLPNIYKFFGKQYRSFDDLCCICGLIISLLCIFSGASRRILWEGNVWFFPALYRQCCTI